MPGDEYNHGVDAIRLLKIYPTNGGSEFEVQCELQDMPAVALPYQAISYTWGPTPSRLHDTREVRVNGKTFRCTPSLKKAFSMVRLSEQHLWVDAICIDQHNLGERSYHVNRMKEMYAQDVLRQTTSILNKVASSERPFSQHISMDAICINQDNFRERGRQVERMEGVHVKELRRSDLGPSTKVLWREVLKLLERHLGEYPERDKENSYNNALRSHSLTWLQVLAAMFSQFTSSTMRKLSKRPWASLSLATSCFMPLAAAESTMSSLEFPLVMSTLDVSDAGHWMGKALNAQPPQMFACDEPLSSGIFVLFLATSLVELMLVYRLRPTDRYKSRAMGVCLLAILLLCGFCGISLQQMVILELVGLNLALLGSAVAHSLGTRTLATPGHVALSRETLDAEDGWTEVDEKNGVA